MQKIFYPDSVTIVRKKGDSYSREDIMTRPVLPDGGLSPEANRSNVIARLRRDPSVVLVLEDRGGFCEEAVELHDGLLLRVRATECPVTAAVTLSCEGDEVYREDITAGKDEDSGDYDYLERIVRRLTDILECIACGDFSFLPDDAPHFVPVERGEPVGYYDACRLLKEGGYQTETVHTVGFVRNPVLFVHENDVVMLGSHRFAGDELFLEMKRLFNGVSPDDVRAAAKELGKESVIEVIEWEDGSWSFRATMDEDLDRDNFIDRLQSDLSGLREFISGIEERLGEEPWPIMKEQRQLFIYEVIEASLKLSRIKI